MTFYNIQLLFVLLFINASNSFAQEELDSSNFSLSISENREEEWNYPDSLTKILSVGNRYSEWSKIEITDLSYPTYLNRYSLISAKNKSTLMDSTNNRISNIRKRKINIIIEGLIEQVYVTDSMCLYGIRAQDPLTQFGLDSNWYKSRILDLWDKYRYKKSIELSVEQLEKTNMALLQYSRLNRILKFPNNWNKDESVMVDIKIIYDFDTLHIQATSYFPYMLEWYYFNNKTRLANYEISKLIGELIRLTKMDSDNLTRLKGTNFELCLMDDIYKRYLLKEVL